MPVKKPVDIPQDFTLDLKLESLTLDEIDAIEEITGMPLDALNKPGTRRAPMLKAMAYVTMKRKYPDFTIEDAGALRINLKGKAKPDPTAANA
ncbi:tail protein [Streptomyces phage Lilbooboo]|uniref:Tail assembly chaperone n=1 Tax=Streptomyces phage Lilbooboo TaxID=2510571 RepID=A0A411B2Z3_9CAUD|nr:tail protein [Streptomyces phage Lilbooboo]QAX94710.1 tail assembly chaperone [Streptomyces phage Lilbooboo]